MSVSRIREHKMYYLLCLEQNLSFGDVFRKQITKNKTKCFTQQRECMFERFCLRSCLILVLLILLVFYYLAEEDNRLEFGSLWFSRSRGKISCILLHSTTLWRSYFVFNCSKATCGVLSSFAV